MQNRYGAEEDLYSDGGSETPESSKEELLPLSILGSGDYKVGDQITLTITAIQDDSVRVKLASSEPEEVSEEESEEEYDEEETESESPELAGPAPTPSEMAGMMT